MPADLHAPPAGLLTELTAELGWTEAEAEAGFAEARRFVAFCAGNAGIVAVPSTDVDEVWHRWILHTRDYAAFCAESGAGYVHHQPTADGEPSPTDLYERTIGLLRADHGELDRRWWGAASANCSRCCGSTAPTV